MIIIKPFYERKFYKFYDILTNDITDMDEAASRFNTVERANYNYLAKNRD